MPGRTALPAPFNRRYLRLGRAAGVSLGVFGFLALECHVSYPAKAANRAVLSSGKLGQLNGLPVTVVVYTTLQELESGCGRAVTATGTLLPMPTVIRMASHAYHYLTIFDKDAGRAPHLGRTRRIASADQRIVLLARDRGCTRPGCTVAGARCQVHHAVADWADNGQTNVDDLTLACPKDNREVKPGGWTHPKTQRRRANARLNRR